KASEFAGDTFGQAVDGVWNTASGIIQKMKRRSKRAFETSVNRFRARPKVYQTAKHTYQNGKRGL
ncbi:hypothetical protein F6Y03_00555, partial [Bacillus megaterium]|nr:hypothetical protein [Priestia megaterium]